MVHAGGPGPDETGPAAGPGGPPTVLIAPNAYKGACDAVAAAAAMARGVGRGWPQARVVQVPVADGGDGTAAVLLQALGGRWVRVHATDPWGRPRLARLALLADGTTAVVEVAAASGLGGRRPTPDQALRASSYGTGQLVRRAVELGARRIWLALGGSGCTDGGTGLLAALGARWLGRDGRELPPGGGALVGLERVDLSGLAWLAGLEWAVLVDVSSPLLGPTGSAAVFAPQKGAGPEEVRQLEAGLTRLADVLEPAARRPGVRHMPGSGAAGGTAFGLAAALGATLLPGAEAVARALRLGQRVAEADLVLTGEGRLDGQTAFGKAPAYVARLAQEAGVPAVALAGALGPGWEALQAPQGPLTAVLSLAPGPRSRARALRATQEDLERTAAAAARLVAAGGQLGARTRR
jgi:glycerate kinase